MNKNLFLLSILMLSACTESKAPLPDPTPASTPISTIRPEEPDMKTLTLTIHERSFTVELLDTPTTDALLAQLPLTLPMNELHGNEKYGTLPESLETEEQHIGHIDEGDLMLFGSDCIVLFYESFDTGWNYTPLGQITDTEGLKEALGTGNVTITFDK